MIRAIMFDLDGTLVQFEKLKALSYAIAVQRLRDLPEPEPKAIESYREIVGSSRDVATKHVMDALGLEDELRPHMAQYDATEAWEVLAAMRKEIYDGMVSDPQVIRNNGWPHSLGLVRVAWDTFCQIGLATMSYRKEAVHVLRALDIEQWFDVVLTREDVERPKPDPEIYLTAAKRLNVSPQECLVLEDSPNGVRAGVDAGMNVIAFATPFTIDGLHASGVLEHAWVVHDHEKLLEVVRERIAEHNRTAHEEGEE